MDELVIEGQYAWIVLVLSVAYLGRFVCQRVCGYRNTIRAWVPAVVVAAAFVVSLSAMLGDRAIELG